MIYEILELGDTILYIIMLLDGLFLVGTKDNGVRIGVSCVSVFVFGAFTNFIDVLSLGLNAETFTNIGIYLGIGLASFVALYSISIRLVRKDLLAFAKKNHMSKKQIGEELKEGKYNSKIPSELYNRYHGEPSWEGFFERLFFWPIAVPNFLFGEFLRSFASSAAEWFVKRKKSVVGFEDE